MDEQTPGYTRTAAKPRILGYRASGAPIYEIRGADPLGDLLTEAADISTRLAAPAEGDDVTALITRATEVATAIEEARSARADDQRTAREAKEARARLAGLIGAGSGSGSGGTGTPGGTPAPADQRTDDTDDVETRSIGRIFVEDALPEMRARGMNGNAVMEIPGDVRAVLDTPAWPKQPLRLPGITTFTNRDRVLRIADLIDRQTMGTQTIEWVEETAFTNSAAEVAEGGTKAETTFTYAVKTASASTVAHYVNLTRQAAADDSQMQGYIEGRLVYGLQRRLEDEIVNGNGTAPNLRGILNTSGLGTYTAGTGTEAALISVRKAITVAQLSEYFPDTVVMNPIDWEAIELSTDTTGEFRISPSAQQAMSPRVWGLAVVVSTAITGTNFGTTGGTFLVGSFKEGATLWERQGITLYLTDSHASNFTANILTLLAEFRCALTVWRPKAFVKGTFGASRT